MPFVPAPNCARVEMVFTEEAQFCENVYHVAKNVPYTAGDLATVAADFKTWWNTSIKTLVPNPVALVKILVTALDSESSPGVEYVTGLPINGTSAGVTSPMNVTVAIKWLTDLRGRSYRGRTYHIGLMPSVITGSVVNAGSVTALKAGYNALIGALSVPSGALSVVSYRTGRAWRPSAIHTPITVCDIDPVCDSQRRRLPGRGA